MKIKALGIFIAISTLTLSALMGPLSAHANVLAKTTQLTPETLVIHEVMTPDPRLTPDQSTTNAPATDSTPFSDPSFPVYIPPTDDGALIFTPAPSPTFVPVETTLVHTKATSTNATSSIPFSGTLVGNMGSSENIYNSLYSFSPSMTRTLLEFALVLGASGLVLAHKRSLRSVFANVWD